MALWLRHDSQTSKLLILQFDGQQAPSTFYISEYEPAAPQSTLSHHKTKNKGRKSNRGLNLVNLKRKIHFEVTKDTPFGILQQNKTLQTLKHYHDLFLKQEVTFLGVVRMPGNRIQLFIFLV